MLREFPATPVALLGPTLARSLRFLKLPELHLFFKNQTKPNRNFYWNPYHE